MSEAHSLKNINSQYKPIITVKEARKILGKKISDSLSDGEVNTLIGDTTFLANRLFDTILVPHNNEVI